MLDTRLMTNLDRRAKKIVGYLQTLGCKKFRRAAAPKKIIPQVLLHTTLFLANCTLTRTCTFVEILFLLYLQILLVHKDRYKKTLDDKFIKLSATRVKSVITNCKSKMCPKPHMRRNPTSGYLQLKYQHTFCRCVFLSL